MLRVFADHHDSAFAFDNFALFANLFNGWLYLHFVTIPFLFSTPGYTTLCQIVYRYLNGYLVTRQYPYIVHSEFSRNMGIHNVSVGQLNLEVRIRQRLKNDPLELHNVILWQKNPSSFLYDTLESFRRLPQKLPQNPVGHSIRCSAARY